MMTLNTAKTLALAGAAALTGRATRDLLIIDELTECRRVGWIFFYESRVYLETGDLAAALGSTGPVVVTHQGDVHHLRGDGSAAAIIREFERRFTLRRKLH